MAVCNFRCRPRMQEQFRRWGSLLASVVREGVLKKSLWGLRRQTRLNREDRLRKTRSLTLGIHKSSHGSCTRQQGHRARATVGVERKAPRRQQLELTAGTRGGGAPTTSSGTAWSDWE